MSDDISFIAPDGGDPVDYFERTAYKVGDADPKALTDAAIFLEDRIRVRTANGESFKGGRFIAYNDDYRIQREKAGLESDVLVQGRKTLKLVEVKVGQTISSDWAANNQKILGLFARTKQAVACIVIYGGTEKQERNGAIFLPWHAIQDYSWVD